jgi:hypothetical protein
MKKQNKAVILGSIAIFIIIIIILMTFFYVNSIREEQIKELEEQEKEELSLIDQIENLTYYLGLYQGQDLIYGEGKITNSSSNSNGYYLLAYDNSEYHPKNLPEQYNNNNLTIKFIAFTYDSNDPLTGQQYIHFLRINDVDLELPSK